MFCLLLGLTHIYGFKSCDSLASPCKEQHIQFFPGTGQDISTQSLPLASITLSSTMSEGHSCIWICPFLNSVLSRYQILQCGVWLQLLAMTTQSCLFHTFKISTRHETFSHTAKNNCKFEKQSWASPNFLTTVSVFLW